MSRRHDENPGPHPLIWVILLPVLLVTWIVSKFKDRKDEK